MNAYAWPALREIEAQRPVSEAALAAGGHELGHVAEPCHPTHTRVPRPSGIGSLCCACELAAWKWCALHLCRWTLPMHQEMGRCLRTYRPYASGDEQSQIDRLCSPLGFHELRLKRVMNR